MRLILTNPFSNIYLSAVRLRVFRILFRTLYIFESAVGSSVASIRSASTIPIPQRLSVVYRWVEKTHLPIVGWHNGRKLYIADCYKCIWRVPADHHSQSVKWLEMEYDIMSLSVTSQRLLMWVKTWQVRYGF